MGKVVVIAGLPGAGKTTVVRRMVDEARERGLPVRLVTYGSVMLQIAVGKNLVSDRDELRGLPLTIQQRLQREASERIGEMGEGDEIVIVDTHMIVSTPRGMWTGISVANLESLGPVQFVLVEAEPEEILKRREKDQSRKRDIEEIRRIEGELKYTRYIAAACSVMTGSPVATVDNRQGEVEVAVEDVLSLIRAVASD